MNGVACLQGRPDTVHERIARVSIRHDEVGSERALGRTQAPYMQVMYVRHTRLVGAEKLRSRQYRYAGVRRSAQAEPSRAEDPMY